MAKRRVITSEDEILRKQSRPVTEFNERLHELLDDMAETMYDANGVGLAAVQVGILRRVVIIDTGEQKYELVNPEIIETSGEQEGPEGCLSFPEEWGVVVRPMYVKVKAFDRNGKEFIAEGEELLARAFCHEIDHLDGKLFVDLAKELEREEETPRPRRKRRGREGESQ